MRPFVTLLGLLVALPASAQPFFVANQGDFGQGTGSVTEIAQTDGGAAQLFEGQLGSILQSVTHIEDRLYLVTNSANRIDIVDTETNARIGQITDGLSGPRYLQPSRSYNDPIAPGFEKAYVTNHVYDGTSSYVLPLNLSTGETGEPIPVDGLPESVVFTYDDKAYVALGTFGPGSGGVDSVAVIDVATDALTGYIDIGCYARFVVQSQASDEVLAFCEDTDEAVVIDTRTEEVVQRLAFGEDIGDPFGVGQSVGPGSIVILVRRASPPSMSFFVITASGVAEVEQTADGSEWAIARTIPIADADTRPISAVSVGLGGIALGRPDPDAPFSADGTVTVHDYTTGALLATFPAGIYPAHIAIDERFGTPSESVAEGGSLALALAGPHPVRQRTALALTLDRAADVAVEVFDVLGRPVARLADGARGVGTHRVEVDASGLPAGLYLVRAVADGRAVTLPLTVAGR